MGALQKMFLTPKRKLGNSPAINRLISWVVAKNTKNVPGQTISSTVEVQKKMILVPKRKFRTIEELAPQFINNIVEHIEQTMLPVVNFAGGGKMLRTEKVLTNLAPTLKGDGGRATRTEIALTNLTPTLTGGGGLATRTEEVFTETVILASGGYP